MEIEQDVIVDPSPTEQEEVVNESELEAGQEATTDESQVVEEEVEEAEVAEELPPQGEADLSHLDENGVPWKNRAMEAQRKFGELADTLPQMIEDSISKANSKKETTQYTIAQLESYAQEHPEYRAWAEEEKAKIQQASYAKIVDEKLSAKSEEEKLGKQRQSAYSYVYQTYPECFSKNTSGQIVFNSENQLTREITNILNDPEIAKNPRGLMVAADMAYARLARANSGKTAGKVKTLNSNLKKAQRKTLVNGGTQNVPQVSPVRKSIDQLSKTGNKKDAQTAIAQILQSKGVLK